MQPVDAYRTSRRRLVELAPSMTPQQLHAPLAATPPWTVLDGYRHLAGVCSNVVDGVMEGAGSPAWTAAQISDRSHATIDEVCAEWNERAPALDERVEAAGNAMAFVAFDAWTHEQDIRAAIGLHGHRDQVATALAATALTTLGGRYASSGAPTVRIDLGDQQAAALGSEETSQSLRITPYELLRAIFGRRSRRQLEALEWSDRASAGAVIDALHIFALPDTDIVD